MLECYKSCLILFSYIFLYIFFSLPPPLYFIYAAVYQFPLLFPVLKRNTVLCCFLCKCTERQVYIINGHKEPFLLCFIFSPYFLAGCACHYRPVVKAPQPPPPPPIPEPVTTTVQFQPKEKDYRCLLNSTWHQNKTDVENNNGWNQWFDLK